MGWIKGYNVVAGVLNGTTLSGEIGLNRINWSAAPDITSQNLHSCVSSDAGLKLGGAVVLTSLKDTSVFPIGQDVLLAALDITGTQYDLSRLMIWVRNLNGSGTFEWKVWRRDWTGSNYTDTNLTNVIVNSFAMYFNNQYQNTIGAKFLICQDRYQSTNMVWIGFTWSNESWLGDMSYYANGFTCPISNFATLLGGDIPQENTSPEFGPAAEPGGGYNEDGSIKGSFDDSSDKITPSSKPTLSPLVSKFFHAYVVTEASMTYIADAMFPQPIWTQTDLITMMGEVGQVLFFNKQMDYVLDLLILPIDVPHTTWEAIKVGGKQLKTVISGTEITINGQPAINCYVDVSCGSLQIPEYWANFLDFAGTRFKLFLPYVGFVDIEPEYINGGRLAVDYRFNIIDGSFMCYVTSTSGQSELEESMIGQYAGVAAVHVPLQSQDYSNKVAGMISAIGTVAAGAASGGIGAATAVGAGASAANTMIQKPGSTHANGYNASSSFLSHRKPYVIIQRQRSQFSEMYPSEVGLPLNVMMTLGNCVGLTKAESAHLNTIPCSVEGQNKISSLLAEGIIL